MAPNAYPPKGFHRPPSSLSSGGYSSDSSASSYRPEFVTPSPGSNQSSIGWNKVNGYRSPFDYSDSVCEMDRQLAKIRTSPSKVTEIFVIKLTYQFQIIIEKNKFIAHIDMSNFKPEDIEVSFFYPLYKLSLLSTF